MDPLAGVFIKDSTMRRGKPIHAQAREIVYNVYQYFVKESFKFKKYMDNDESYYFKKVQERVCNATGISRKTVGRILTEAENTSSLVEIPSTSIKFNTPKKGRVKRLFRAHLENFDYDVIRRTVFDFHLKYRELPTLRSLRVKLSETIGYKGSDETMRRILREMGMRFVKIEKNKRVLVEKHDERLKRIEYLEKIKAYRTEGKNIVYVGETTIDLSHSKAEDGKIEVKKRKGDRLVVVYAGNETGFVPGAFMMYQPIDMNVDFQNYENWLRNQLIVNIPKDSVLVIDDSPNNNKYVERPPNVNTIKEQMINWLNKHDIPVDATLPKPKIYAIICRHKDNLSEYAVDKLLEEHGHTTLRLPSYHAKFNPLESIWKDLKGHVAGAATNEYGNMNLATAKKLLTEKVNMFGVEEWKQLCEQAIKCEDEYRKEEYALDEYLDRILANDCDYCSDGECYVSSDSETEVMELDD